MVSVSRSHVHWVHTSPDDTIFRNVQVYLRTNPDKMRMDYALSREGPLNKKGGKMYIQDKVKYAEHALCSVPVHFCGCIDVTDRFP